MEIRSTAIHTHQFSTHLRDCSTLECFAEWHRPCPNSTATAGQLTLLPTYPTYGAEQVRKNIEAIRDFFGVGPA